MLLEIGQELNHLLQDLTTLFGLNSNLSIGLILDQDILNQISFLLLEEHVSMMQTWLSEMEATRELMLISRQTV